MLNRRTIHTTALIAILIVTQACGANDLSRLHSELNRAAQVLNAAAKTNHQFYESGIYGPVGSEKAIKIRQSAATAINKSNEALIQALTLAKALTPETFEQGKLVVLQKLADAAAGLRIGNDQIDLVLQGVATAINAAVLILQTFKSSDLEYVLPRIQSWQIARVSA
jgi:hypothetical protein